MSAYIPIISLLIIVFIVLRDNRSKNIRRIIRKRRKKGFRDMSEVFNRYIGKDCVVYLSNTSSNILECKVTSVSDNWLTVESRDGVEIINVDYIIRIKEHPLNKNGKKKSVIF